ncbi:MAG TPA: ATP-binding protein [Thermoanaerobaculia bacterium]|nr:ATP-binding protein [Thermoanaerobaculia bacterium]
MEGRSPSLDPRDRRLHRISELTLADHPDFVGRARELAKLGAQFVGTARSIDVRPVALVTGLGGMGKTALAAEVFDIWTQRFEWVLPYQAKPNALGFETTLCDIHLHLYAERGLYYKHVQEYPADAIYRDADAEFAGTERIERLTRKLVRAFRDEAILLVLDNFESNLKPAPEPDGDPAAEPLWACADPDWDRCLALLATELVGTPSRVLITCRHQLAGLAGDAATGCLRVRLSPLRPGEAALYLREHQGLSRMVYSGDVSEKELAERLLQASRFHPLLMDRLARLATGGLDLRPQLMAALDAIDTNHDATKLPELFASSGSDAAESAYLENALVSSIEELIRGASPEARRLLWIIAVANEPVQLEILRSVWSGEDGHQQTLLRKAKGMLEILPQLSAESQALLRTMPSDVRALIASLPPEALPLPSLSHTPSLAYIVAVGLVDEERTGPDDQSPDLICHELVRERIRAWMLAHPDDCGDFTENIIRLAFANQL